MMKLLSSIVLLAFLALGNTVGAQQLRPSTKEPSAYSMNAAPTTGETSKKIHGMEALITMNGLTHDNPAEQHKYFIVLGDAVVVAFNAVDPKAGIIMNSVDVKKEVDVPETGSNDDESNVTDGLGGKKKKKNWGSFWSYTTYYSGHCGNDCGTDDATWNSPPLMTFVKTAPATQKKFEKILCRLLCDSGLDTFADVHNCKVVYLHKPHDGPGTEDTTVVEE